MKKITFALLGLAGTLSVSAQNSSAPTNSSQPAVSAPKSGGALIDFGPELDLMTSQLKAKFDAGKTTATDLAENLQAINSLAIHYVKTGNREQLARLYLLDAHIYADGLKDTAKARAIWGQVIRQFPGTLAAKGASLSIARLEAAEATDPGPNVAEGLEVGQKFPNFISVSLTGSPLSVTAYRGKVTMIDFWATWCPPCRAEMPNVIAIYNHYHAQGFDIIGVSLDSDRSDVENFTQAKGMPWAQYFDGLAWKNKLAAKYGVESIPMTYLLDGHGVIIGKELRGEELQRAVVAALAGH